MAQLRAEGRAVFGVAPSATAAEVLSAETGVAADTIDKLLIEHRLARPPQPEFDLPGGATVICDETAMVPTAKLAELADLSDRRGWRLVLVGDPLQFSAVGRSGMFGHLVECFGAVELDRVRRFSNPWERDASLGLRRGDASVLEAYDHHGRLHAGSRSAMASAVVDAWSQARGRGEDVAMMAPTAEAVADLNRRGQWRRAAAGEIDMAGTHVVAGGYQIHVGDVVATRRNDRGLRTDCGHMVKNRDLWQVTAIKDHGGLVLTGRTGTLRLPGDYVKAHVELAYAQTSHANQGRTVDTSLVFIDAPVDTAGVYVPMTRGRHSNEAFVVTDGQRSAIEVLGDALAREWIDEPAIVRRNQLSAARRPEPARRPAVAVSTLEEQAPPPVPDSQLRPAALRDLFEADYELTDAISRIRFDVDQAQRDRMAAARQAASVNSTMNAAAQRIEWANQRLASYDRAFKRHRHRFDISSDHSIIDAARAAIDQGREELAALEAKSRRLGREVVDAKEQLSRVPELEADHHRVRARLRADLEIRAERLSVDSMVVLPHHLSQRPANGIEAAAWDRAAARIEQHRVAFSVADDAELLGPAPGIFDDAYAASRRGAQEATHAMATALGRDHGIEREGPELSL
ncbi:MAG TPA: AAA family ATPase [Acidimicrobiales bacterium]|nr:AAA family ATPase [Acidimicrobiales bacterium]